MINAKTVTFLQCYIQCCVSLNILENGYGHFCRQVGEVLLVASSYQPVKLDYIYFLFYEFVHDCFDLG